MPTSESQKTFYFCFKADKLFLFILNAQNVALTLACNKFADSFNQTPPPNTAVAAETYTCVF